MAIPPIGSGSSAPAAYIPTSEEIRLMQLGAKFIIDARKGTASKLQAPAIKSALSEALDVDAKTMAKIAKSVKKEKKKAKKMQTASKPDASLVKKALSQAPNVDAETMALIAKSEKEEKSRSQAPDIDAKTMALIAKSEKEGQAQAELLKSFAPDLVENVKPLKEFATRFAEGSDCKKGLEKLDRLGYMQQKIIGDGHCLFRSTATFLVKKWERLSGEGQNEYLKSIKEKVERLANPDLTEKHKLFEEALKDIASKRCSIGDVIYNEKKSNQLVAFLRRLVCEHNREKVKNDESLLASIVENTADVTAYFTNMVNMERAAYGGTPELRALAETLDMNIRVLDVCSIGQDHAVEQAHLLYAKEGAAGDTELYLIYRNLHYDLGVKTKAVPPAAAAAAAAEKKGI